MTCRCTAEFCMICGARWKTCDCPWFNYNPVPDDRLYMNIPGQPEPVQVHYRRVHPNANPHLPNQPQQYYAYNPRNPALNYQQEIDRRRTQERADEQLARRLQVLGFADDDEVDVYGGGAPGGAQGLGREWGIGNAGNHFMNENYVRNAADLITAPYGHARVRAADGRPAAAAVAAAAGGRGLATAPLVDPAAQAVAAQAAAAAHLAAAAATAANAAAAPQPVPVITPNTSARRRSAANPAAVTPTPAPAPAPAAAPAATQASARGGGGVGRTRSYSERAREIFGGRRGFVRRNSGTAAATDNATAAAGAGGGPAAGGAAGRPRSQQVANGVGVGASMMAGLAMDGSRTGMGRVGTWLQHVVYDPMAVQTAAVAG
ncbi:MAG: hypothetical protein M1822_002713 [Bathelium mastoideum]|nr:MAG: hypothetical protein M1822_002713 [Bathelium mastoideum]